MSTFSVTGKAYPCQFFMPLSMGLEKSLLAEKLIFEEIIPIEHIDEKCRPCVIRDLCSTCYGSNYKSFGNIYKKDTGLCNLMKTCYLATAYLKFQKISKGYAQYDDKLKARYLRGIKSINENIKVSEK